MAGHATASENFQRRGLTHLSGPPWPFKGHIGAVNPCCGLV